MVEPSLGMPPPPKKHQFFNKQPAMPDMSNFTSDIRNLSRRLRLLEESFTNMRRSSRVIEQNIQTKHKNFSSEIKTINSDISEIRNDILEIKDKILLLFQELKSSAKLDQLKVLEKYINLWNPVKFVTQNEVETMIKDLINKNK